MVKLVVLEVVSLLAVNDFLMPNASVLVLDKPSVVECDGHIVADDKALKVFQAASDVTFPRVVITFFNFTKFTFLQFA